MLILNPRGYSQGAVQQLCKCQGAQEVISLVPKAPWMLYCGKGEAWGNEGMERAGELAAWDHEIKSGFLGLTVEALSACSFYLGHSSFLAIFQTCSAFLLYTSPTHAFVPDVPLARSALSPLSSLTCARKGTSNAFHWDPFTNPTAILSPLSLPPIWI